MDDKFNLPGPPGFVGFDERQPVRIYHRHLPHWRQNGAFYAVTFRLGDSLPQSKLQQLKRLRKDWERANPTPRDESQWKRFAKEVTQMSERWLDEGFGACHLRDPKNAKMMADALRFYNDTKCFVPCFTVMPNHIHAIMSPLPGFQIETILKSIKGWSANRINKQIGARGSLWTQESYDRIIRDDEHLFRVVQYIGQNGRTAGLSKSEYLRWIAPDWEAVGWGFRDV